MPLSEKALRAYKEALAKRGYYPVVPNLEAALFAFQAALLEELREKVNGAPCASGSHPVAESSCLLRRDAVLALLSPPPPEPKFKPGDWVYGDGDVGLARGDMGVRSREFVVVRGGGVRSGIIKSAERPATDEEVRRARGEEQP